jgi:hypothetical protein
VGQSPNEAVWNALYAALTQAQERSREINRGAGGREMALVITKIQEALHWCADADNAIVGS